MTVRQIESNMNTHQHGTRNTHHASRFTITSTRCLRAWTSKLLWTFVLGVWSFSAPAALYTYNVNSAIPDNNTIGLTDSHTISGLLFDITDVRVTLNIAGGYNGDLYGYLRLNNSPLVVLLNRVGVTGSDPDGYADSGFSVTLAASAAHDIHFYQNFSPSYNGSGQLTGTWQADGRTDPLSSSRGSLSDFNGYNPNGTWTLFFADQAAGDQSTLVSWSLDITAVPEPVNVALAIFGGLAVLARLISHHRYLLALRPMWSGLNTLIRRGRSSLGLPFVCSFAPENLTPAFVPLTRCHAAPPRSGIAHRPA